MKTTMKELALEDMANIAGGIDWEEYYRENIKPHVKDWEAYYKENIKPFVQDVVNYYKDYDYTPYVRRWKRRHNR